MLMSPCDVLRVLEQPAAGLAAFLDEVRADQRQIQRVVGDLDRAVGEDHRDVRGLGFAQHRFPAGFDHGRERDDVDALGDERAQRLDLVFLLLLRVRETQRDAGFRRGALDGGGVGRAPFAFGADLAEAEHDGFGAIAGRDFGSPPEQATSRAAAAAASVI